MDIRLDDGTIIRNVPDGMTKEQVQAKVDSKRARDTGTTGGDYLKALASGVNRIGASIAGSIDNSVVGDVARMIGGTPTRKAALLESPTGSGPWTKEMRDAELARMDPERRARAEAAAAEYLKASPITKDIQQFFSDNADYWNKDQSKGAQAKREYVGGATGIVDAGRRYLNEPQAALLAATENVPQIGVMAVTRKAPVETQLVLGRLGEAQMTAEEARQSVLADAKQKGASPSEAIAASNEAADNAFSAALAASMVGGVGEVAALRRLTGAKGAGPVVEHGIMQIPKQAGKEAAEEFIQEGSSQIAQNAAISGNYDPARALLEGAGVAGVHGAVAGGVMGAGTGAMLVPGQSEAEKAAADAAAAANPQQAADRNAAMDELRTAAEQGQQPAQPAQPQDITQPAPAPQEPASGLSGVVQRAQASTAPDITTVVNEAIASGQTPDFSALAQAANRDRSEVVDLFNRRRTLVDLADAGDLNGMRDMAARMTADPQEQQSLIEQAVAVRDKRRVMASQPQPTQQAEPQQPATPIKTPRDTAYEKMLADAEASLASGASDVDTFLAVRKKYAGNKDLAETDINGVIDDAKASLSGKREAAAKREAAIESAIPHLKAGDEVSAVTALADAGITDDADIQAVFKEANSRLKAKPAAAQAKPQQSAQPAVIKSPMEQAVESVSKAQEGGKGVKLATIAKKYGVGLVDLAKQVAAAKTAPINTKQPEERKASPVLALPAPKDAPVPADQPLVSRRGKLLPRAQADAMAEQSAAEKRDMRRAMSEEAGNPTGVPTGMRPRVETPARAPQKAVLPDVILRTDGEPFQSETEATRAMNRKGAQETHEVAPAPQGNGVVIKRKKANAIDMEKDDILAAIAKAGGVNWDQARKHGGFDPAESGRRGSGILRVFKKNGGMTLDGMAETLSQYGYPVTDENGNYTVNALLDAMDEALRGGQVGTAQFNERIASQMHEQEAEWQPLDDAFDGKSSGSVPAWLDDGADALVESVIDGETQPSAVLADALNEVENERTIASQAAGTGQKTESGAEAGAGQGSNAPTAGPREGGQQEGQGGAGQDSGVQAGFQLTAQTEAERLAEEQRHAADLEAKRKEDESKAASQQAKDATTDTAESKPEPVKWFGSRDKAEAWITKVSKVNGGSYHVVQAGPSRFEVFPGKKPAAPVEPNAFPIGKDGMPLRKAIVPLSQADALIALMDGNKIIFNRDTEYQEEIWLEENTARNTWVVKTRSGGAVVTEGPAGPGKAWSQMDAAAKAVEGKTYKADLRGKAVGNVLTDADGTLYRIESLDDEGTITLTKNPGMPKESRTRIQQDRYDRILAEDADVKKTSIKPAEDLDSMFDDVLAEVTGKPKAEPAKQERTAGQESVESAFTGEPDPRNSAPMQELGGFAVGDKVSISGRSFSEGVIRKLFTRQSVGGEMRMARVEVAGDKTLDLLIDNLSIQERTAGQAAASAAKNTGMALGEAIDGLGKLFGGKGTLGSGPVFDEETYAKARPYFIAAISHLKAAGSDLREAMRAVIKMVVDKFGAETAENMKPYVVQFISDVRDGKIDDPAATLKGSDTNEATGNDVRKLDTTGQGALEGVSSGEVQGAGTGRGTGSGVAEGGRGNGGADGSVAGAGGERDGGVGNRTERVPVSGTGAGGSGRGRSRSSGGNGRAVSAQPAAGNEQVNAGGLTADTNQPSEALEPGRIDPPQLPDDFIIEEDFALGEGGQRTKYKNNVEAIRLIRDLEATGRTATTDEQKVLAKYVGWGGIPQAFDPENKDWSAQYAELKSLLSADEWDAAFESTQYAHYTSREIINGMYAAVRRLGFTGGNVLEAGGGVGNFIGLMPVDLRTNGKVTLVERETIAAAIAKHLYPRQNVRAEDFTEFGKGQDSQYDMQIGNPPFSSNPLTDKSGRKHLTGLSVHNYFISKGVDMLREGGIMAVVVSNSFMDAGNVRAREYIAKRAKLLGAIRLPNNAFSKNANTQVTTDIIFLQKLPESAHGSKAAIADGKRWVGVTTVSDPQGKGDVALNQYFADNHGMMLGEWGKFGTMYGPDQPALVARPGQDTGAMLMRAIAALPEGVYTTASVSRTKAMGGALLEKLHDKTVDEGGFYVNDGKLWRRVADSAGEEYAAEITPNTVISGTRPIGQSGVDRLRQLAELRRTMRELLAAETEDRKADMDRLRKDLNSRYDAYVADNGRINDPTTKRLMRDDPDYPLIAALEMDYEPGIGPAAAKAAGIKPQTSKSKKAAIFNQRVIEARKAVTKADSPQDAINISMAERGRLDAEYIGRLLDVPADEVLGQLASGAEPLLFRDPATGEYALRDAYLSGNVREKLKQAKAAGLTSNVRALEAVQPEDIPASKISVRIGSPWVPVGVYADFATSLFGDGTKTILRYVKSNGGFSGVIVPGSEVMASTKFGTKDYHGDAILLALMNNRQIKVMTKDGDGKPTVDAKATEEANSKADDIKQAFQDWIFKDADRAEILVRAYNDANNNYVVRKYDGSWLKFPGKVPDAVIRFRRHQRNAIARTIQDRTTLYDHVVGAGKTFTAIASAMEMRRMGLIRKPLMVVPNHLVGQWASDFYRLYPGAKVLAATKKDFERENRRRFLAKIASGDWDAVIIAHSSFERIRPSPEFEQKFTQAEIDRIMREAKEVEASDGDEQQKKRTVKQLAAMKERLENRIAKLREKPMDDLLDFQQLGVDQLFVDEAHLFKNLMFTTKMQNVRGLGDPTGSQRAYDMYIKTNQIMEQNGRGQGVAFMTGTPVSNSLAEMYHMMRYLMPEQMRQLGFESFDAWANTYASVNQVWMQTAGGDGFKAQNRMSNFDNVPELLRLFDQVADTVTMDDIKAAFKEETGKDFPLPKLLTGRRQPVSLDKTPAQEAYMKDIIDRLKRLELRKGPPRKGEDNHLTIMSDARKAAMDIRLVDMAVIDREKGARVDRASDEIFARWKKYDADRGTQLVFADLGTPISTVKNEVKEYDAIMARISAGEDPDTIAMAQLGDEEAAAKVNDAESAREELDAKGKDWLTAIEGAKRGFSVYDDLKKALMEKGIPENQIAFIHSYNTDDQKAALFRKVNSGEIRILMGSTAKMGAGTNVQRRLVALHHLDVPWKPSDLEQREGRIIRQGNELADKNPDFEVEILAYVTKDTLDMRMWQIQEVKLKMINQLRTRSVDRELENAFEDMEMSAGEMQAAATGNMDMLREIQLRTEVQKLEKKQRAFDAGKADAIAGIRRATREIERIPAQIATYERLSKASEDVLLDVFTARNKFKATINGKEYSNHTEAAKVLRDLVDAVEVGDDGKERKAKLDVSLNGEQFTNRQKLAEAFARLTGDNEPFVFDAGDGKVYRVDDAADAVMDTVASARDSDGEKLLGNMGDYKVSIEYSGEVFGGNFEEFDVHASVGDDDLPSAVVRAKPGDDRHTAKEILKTVRNMVRDAGSALGSLKASLEKAKKNLADLSKIDTTSEWPDSDKLARMREEHRRLRNKINRNDGSLSYDVSFFLTEEDSGMIRVVGESGSAFSGQPAAGFSSETDASEWIRNQLLEKISKDYKDQGIQMRLIRRDSRAYGAPEYIVTHGSQVYEPDGEYYADRESASSFFASWNDTLESGVFTGKKKPASPVSRLKGERMDPIPDYLFSAADTSGPGLTTSRAREILSADPVLSKALPFIDIRNSKEGVPDGAEPFGEEGYYHNGRITLFADNIRATGSMSAEERLKWVAFHEITHRGVANLAESQAYLSELERAGKNPYVKNLAKKIYEARQELDEKYHVSMEVAAEEALAEINAALRTGNVKQIKEQYGLHFPLSIRPRAKSAVARFIEAVKRIINRMFGRRLTGAQIENLLRRTNDSGMTPDGGPGRGRDYDAAVFSLADKGDGSPTEAALAEARRQLDEQLTIADRMIAERGGLFAPNGEKSKLSRYQWAQVRTANFKRWFGDWEGSLANSSKVVDANGEPLAVYHATDADFSEFSREKLGSYTAKNTDSKAAMRLSKAGFWFSELPLSKRMYTKNDMAVFLNIRSPYKPDGVLTTLWNKAKRTSEIIPRKNDGIVVADDEFGQALSFVAQEPNQIKSATGNVGTFSGRTDDIRYSPSPKDWITEQGRITKRVLSKEVAQRDLTLWQKTLGTQLNAALKNPAFKKVYDLTQRLIQHVNNDAYDSLNAAPDVLSRLEDWNDYKRDIANTAKEAGAALTLQQSKRRKDMAAAAEVLFEGTRFDKKVYSDAELDAFKLTADQKEIYRQARAAIDKSVGNAGKSQALNVAMNAEAINWATVERLVNLDLDPEVLFSEVSDLIDARIAATKMEAENSTNEAEIKKLDKQAEKLAAALASIGEIQAIVEKSATEGYAPLMRWGKYTVAVIDPVDGKTLRFHMLESKREQAALELQLREKYGVANVVGGVLDEGKFEQFKGITPETVALFASVTGMDQDAAYQEYLKLAIPGRSALKRKIHRKGDMGEGIEGFSTDLPRVLSSFVLSNARKSARDLYRGPINDAIKGIKVGGGVAAKARELAEFVLEPDENDWSVGIRNMLFVWNMGASVAFGVLNLSQPWMMTLPWLSQFSDPASAAGVMAKAAKLAASAQASGKAPKGYEAEYSRAVREGIVDPQNVFMLQGVERGKSGVGTNIWRNVAHGMGLIASATESMNRKLTLIAALDVARAKGDDWLKSKGFADAYDFAARAVAETQGVYNKGNRPAWARNPALAVILVFKQYSINWVEMASRMASNHYGDDRYRKGFWMLIGVLFMMAGGMGLPFADDLIDLIESGMSWAGKPVNVERQMQMALGKDLYEPLMNGPVNSLLFNPMGADMFGRMSMGNMIPATAVANPGLTWAARSDEAVQALGAGAGLASKFVDAYNQAASGNVGQALITASPRAVTSIAKAVEMATTNQYKDSKGRTVRSVTPAEALIKGLDLQPASVARIQRERGRRFKDEAIQAQAKETIRNALIDAYESGDQDAIEEANARLRDWNDENPLYPVHINRRALRKTVRERGKNWSARDEAAKGMEWMNDWIPESSK